MILILLIFEETRGIRKEKGQKMLKAKQCPQNSCDEALTTKNVTISGNRALKEVKLKVKPLGP